MIDDNDFAGVVASVEQCSVAGVMDVDGELTVSLAGCKADPDDPDEEPAPHVIQVEADPAEPVDLAAGESVRLSMYVGELSWRRTAFTVRRLDDTLILAGSRADRIPGTLEDGTPGAFAAPFIIEGVEGVCPPALPPPPPPPDCSFLSCEPECEPVRRREAIAFSVDDGPTLQLMDRAAAPFPGEPYSIVVSEASTWHFLEDCAHPTDARYDFVIVRH